MDRRAIAAIVAIAGLTVVVGVVPVGAMWLRLHPFRGPLDDDPGGHGLAYESITFASVRDGTRLAGWYLPAPRPTGRTIVIAPGLDDDRRLGDITLRLAPRLLDAGFDVLTFDLRAQGESGDGPITFGAREQWDVLAAVRAARARGATLVGVLGSSMGAAAAILATADSTEIDALVAESAFADLESAIRHELGTRDHLPGPAVSYVLLLERLLSGTDPASVSPVRAIGSIAPRPVLLIQGGADETVPEADSARLLAAAGPSATRWIVPGGRHARSYDADPAGYADRVTAFFLAAMPTT